MAKFTYNGDEVLVYPNIVTDGAVLVAEPGKAYDLDQAPDERWSGTQAPTKAPAADPVSPEVSTDPTPTN
jgi:hypothetical protein